MVSDEILPVLQIFFLVLTKFTIESAMFLIASAGVFMVSWKDRLMGETQYLYFQHFIQKEI